MARPSSAPDSILRKEPKVPEFIQRGKVLIVRRQYQEAVKVCRLGLLAHPTFIEGRLVLGMALMALSRHDEVLAEMRVALELDPDNPMAHLLKGEALYFRRDYEQSREVLEHAHELDPLNEKVRKLLDEIDDVVDYGHEAGPRAKTETKVYPAQRAHEVAFGEDPSDVLGPGGGFSEWESGIELDEPTKSEGPSSSRGDDETVQYDEQDQEEGDTDVDDPLAELDEAELDEGEEEDDEYTTAPFLPPTHMAHNLSAADSEWSDSTIAEDGDRHGDVIVSPEDLTEEKEQSKHGLRGVPSVIIEDQTLEAAQADEQALEWAADDADDEQGGWGELEPARPGSPDPDVTRAVENAGAADAAADLDEEEPTWVPGGHREEPLPLGEIGTYELSSLNHDEPTVVPVPDDERRRAAALHEQETIKPIRSDVGLEVGASAEHGLDDDYGEEEEEDDTVVNADAPPPEALFGEEVPLAPGSSDPRGVDDPTRAMEIQHGSVGAALAVNQLAALERTPSLPRPDNVVYTSGVEVFDDDSGTREFVSADRGSGVDLDGAYAPDVQVLTPPPGPAPLPPLGARMLYEDSGLEELASADIILADEDPPEDLESDISEISVEMIPDEVGEMPPLPLDAHDLSLPGGQSALAGEFDSSQGAGDLYELPVHEPQIQLGPASAPVFDISAPQASRGYGEGHQGGDLPARDFPYDVEEVQDSGELATRVKFDLEQAPYDPHEQIDPLRAVIGLGAGEGSAPDHRTFAFEHGDQEPYLAGEPAYAEPAYAEPAYAEPAYGEPAYAEPAYAEPAYAEPAYAEPAYAEPAYAEPAYAEPIIDRAPAGDPRYSQRPLMPEEQDEDELTLEPADESGEQAWQRGQGTPERTAAIEQDDDRVYPYDGPFPPLSREPTLETSPGGPLGLRGQPKPGPRGAGDGMLEQMTGESGLFRAQVPSPRPVEEHLRRRRMSEGTATSWINILVGEPGSHRWIYLIGAALGVLALAVAVGLAVRYYRLGEQIQAKRSQALARLRAGNQRDFFSAAQSYADILARRSDDGQAQAMHARILAAIPFEFGDPLPGAEERRDDGDVEGGGGERAAADIYASLYGGALNRAAELAIQARKQFPEAAIIPYLQGRVSLLEGNAATAARELQVAHKLDPKDAVVLCALADSLAAQGKTKEALEAYDRALAINKDHIASHLGRARLRVLNRESLIEAEVDLTSITVGSRSKKVATRGQQGWAYLILARLALSRAQLEQAKQHINQARRNSPSRDAWFQDELAGVLIDASQLSDAEAAIRKSKQLMKGRPHPFYHMARIHLLHGRPQAAIEELNKARGLQYAAANVLRARIFLELGRVAEADREADRALGMATEMLEAQIVKAKVLAVQGQGAAAESKLQGLLLDHKDDSRLLTAYGEIFMRMNKLVEARQKFVEALNSDKHAFDARLKLAEVYMVEGNYAEARKSLTEARRINPGNILILGRLARVELAMGDLAEAAVNYLDAKRRAPRDPELGLALAQVYTEQRKFDEAAKEIRQAEKDQAAPGDLALAKGRLRVAQGRGGEALGQLRIATDKLPKQSEAWDLLVRAHLLDNDEPSARAVATKMKETLDQIPEVEATAGRVALNAGRADQAVRHLLKARQLMTQLPRSPRIRAEVLVLLGRANQDNSRLSEAAGFYDDAAAACQACPEPFYRKGLVLDERGESDAAIKSLLKALKINERYAEVHYDLGQVYEGARQKDKAIESYRAYLKSKPPEPLAKAAQEAIQNLQLGQ